MEYKDLKIRHYYLENDKYIFDEYKLEKELDKEFSFDYYDLEEVLNKQEYNENDEKKGLVANQIIYDMANKNEKDCWTISISYNGETYETELLQKDGLKILGVLPSKWKSWKEFGFTVIYIIMLIYFIFFVLMKK